MTSTSSPAGLSPSSTRSEAAAHARDATEADGRARRDAGRRPRCLVVVGSLARGGAERQAVLAAAGLRAAGHDASLFVVSPPLHQLADAERLVPGVDLPRARSGLVRQMLRFERALAAARPDAVITFLSSASLRQLLARTISREARGCVWIVSERGNVHLGRAVRSAHRTLLWARCLRIADRVVVNSSALAANVLGFMGGIADKIEVVPNVLAPFDVDTPSAIAAVRALVGREERGPIVGTVGSVRGDRNLELLARAFPLVVRSHPRAHLLVIGRATGPECGAEAARLRRVAHGLGLADRVTLAGEVPGARALIAGLDVFVLASKLEGSSNALAEALVAGAAIATTPVADAESILAGAGVVSSGWTPRALGVAILEALHRRAHWQARARERGVALLEERSVARVGTAWARVVEEALPS